MSKRAILYARVSSDEQAERGYSLPSQIEACRKYAERLGFSVVAEFKEDHSGAVPIGDRPEGKKMADLVRRRAADAIIIYQVDRLSRAIADLLTNLKIWISAGIEVHSCDVGQAENENDIRWVIGGWYGTDERKKIIERLSRGRNKKARQGKVVGCGKPPYGYRFVNNESLAILESEAKFVRMMYKWYVKGENNIPLNDWTIAMRLSELRIPTPGQAEGKGQRWDHRSRAGLWNYSTVRKILTSETYAGVWYYGKKKGNMGYGGKRRVEEQIAVAIPPIIDRKLWNAAQSRRKYNKRMSKRNGKREYLLRGMVKCGCGFSMSGGCNHGKTRYYKCGRQTRRFNHLEKRSCFEKSVRADLLERLTWDYVEGAIRQADDFEGLLRKAQAQEKELLEPIREQLAAVLEGIEQSEKEARKLGTALINAPEGGVVAKAMQREIDHVEKLYADRIKRRDELQETLSKQNLTDENIEFAMQYHRDVVAGLANPTFENKRQTFRMFSTHVLVQDRKAIVKCIIPGAPGEFDLSTISGCINPRGSSRNPA